MSAAHKDECRGGARQVVKAISKRTVDCIAAAIRYATVNGGFNILFLVLALQFVALVWGAMQ
jgi:hypothetical protein